MAMDTVLTLKTSSEHVKEYLHLKQRWSKCNVRTVWELGLSYGLSQLAKDEGITLAELRKRIADGDDEAFRTKVEKLLEVK